jgi:predicted nucleotidyltransferase
MSKVSDAFATFKSRLELTQTEQDDASRRQKDVRATVQAAFQVDHDFLTGSYGRHTKTKPLKDIDIFVCLGPKEEHRRKAHPKGVLDDLEACLVDAYGRDRVERDRRCVTVWFEKRHQTQHEEGKVVSLDVVPAFPSGSDYEIPDEQLGRWIKTNPATHNDLTTAKNKTLSGNWVPLVKMLKSWNRANGRPIEPSFLVEVMALDLVDGPFNTFPDEARRFFAAAAASVSETWADPAKLGPPVSDEMTPEKCAVARQTLKDAEMAATRAFRAESQGSESEAIRIWKSVFGDFFPAS